jgi:hypothetical protein
MRQVGSAMMIIPLRIQRTPAAQRFAVPATFLRAELAAGKSGTSMAYDSETGAWTRNSAFATQARLRFALPPEVLPCEVTGARLTIKLNAPSRSLLVHSVKDGQDQLFQQVQNPSGVYLFQFDRTDQLHLDAQGGLQFTLAVTESNLELESGVPFSPAAKRQRGKAPRTSLSDSSSESFSTWQIDYVRLDINGQTR